MKTIASISTLICSLLLTGCASLGIDTSTTKEGYTQQITNLDTKYVQVQFKDDKTVSWGNSVEEALKDVNFADFGPLVLVQAKKAFPATGGAKSHTLVLKPLRTEMAATGMTAVRFIYAPTLIDNKTNETVWRMETGIAAGGPLLGTLDEAKAASLISGIKSKLIADKLLAAN
jgi:DNA-binding transcriptional regulator LsrR (DeoR family)